MAPSVGGGAPTGQQQVGDMQVINAEVLATEIIRAILTAAQDERPAAVQSQLEFGRTQLGLPACIDLILLPAVRQLQFLRESGQHDPGQDLLAGEAMRAWLSQQGAFAPPPMDIDPIVLACGPRDRQTIGLESLALLLRSRCWPCRMLGARTSIFTLTVAARAADAVGVVVMSTESRGRAVAADSLRAVDALGIPVFYTGKSFDTDDSRDQLPGRYLGTQMSQACTLLITALGQKIK